MWHRIPLVIWTAVFFAAAFRVKQTFNLVTDSINVNVDSNPRFIALEQAHAIEGFWDGSITAISEVGVLLGPTDPIALLKKYPKVVSVTQNQTRWTWNESQKSCVLPGPAKIVANGVVKNINYDVVVYPGWCKTPSRSDGPLSLISSWNAWPKGSSDAAVERGLEIGDGIGIPLALFVFGLIMRPKLVFLPILAAIVTAVVSLAILGAVASETRVSPLAINVQCAFAFSLAIDYTMFVASGARGFHTVRVSSALLIGTTSTLLFAPSQSIRAMGYAALIAAVVAVLVNQTLIRFVLPAFQKKESDEDDDLIDLNRADPIAARRPKTIVVAMTLLVILSAWACTWIEICGGRLCAAPKSVDATALIALGEQPTGGTVLLGKYETSETVSNCLGPVRRFYQVGDGTFADVKAPIEMSSKFIQWVYHAESCLEKDSTLLADGLDELDIMRGTIDRSKFIAGAVLAIVGGVISVSYAAPVIALKAVFAVVGTFAISLAATSVITGGEICWIVPIVCFPVSIGLGMDFHVFFLDGITSRDRLGILEAIRSTKTIITGAGLILTVAFLGLAMVPVLLVRQISVFLATTAIADTFLMRPFVIPAAMILLGKYNWICLIK